jgi:long-chain acyl-CoA synthetase
MEHRITAPHLAELYRRAAACYDRLPAFATRKSSLEWIPVSFRDLYEQGLALATALIHFGVKARDHVGLFGDNRFEWILADYGVQLSGATDVPRGGDVTDHELVYIINHAGIHVAFVETAALQEQILRLRPQLPGLREIILLDPRATAAPGVLRLGDLLAQGEQRRAEGDTSAEERIQGIQPEDLFTLIYTSGTTGQPKGVMLTHANMMSQMETIPIPVGCNDRVLSILPVWHIFERVFEILAISRGACTYYSSIRTFADDLKNVEPTFMGSAPRLWESLHHRILKNVRASHPVRRALFRIAYFLGHHYQDSVFFLTGRRLKLHPPSLPRTALLTLAHAVRWLLLLPWYGFFNAAVLERIRQAAGGGLKATVSGGGALPAEIDRFFNAIGIPVLEGYGLTETAPVLAVRTHKTLVVGTVGPPVAGTDIRIVCLETGTTLFPNPDLPHGGRGQRGEICARGPQVMRGYFRDAEGTARALQEGWLHTGDLGMITFNDCLKILGRCKDTVVLSSGENLEPGPIEMRLQQSPLIEQCMVVGQDRKYIGALIVPNLEGLREHGLTASSLSEVKEDPQARRLIRDEIRRMISHAHGFKNFEHIHDFELLTEPFRVGGELTNLFKLKRHVIEDKYAAAISRIFDHGTARKAASRHGN